MVYFYLFAKNNLITVNLPLKLLGNPPQMLVNPILLCKTAGVDTGRLLVPRASIQHWLE
jgi:hypothetical protein